MEMGATSATTRKTSDVEKPGKPKLEPEIVRLQRESVRIFPTSYFLYPPDSNVL